MSESIEAYNELRAIRARVEGIEHTQEILIRAHANDILEEIFARFDADPTLARVFLLVDSKRTQRQIAASLEAEGFSGTSEATVSRKLEVLAADLALVELHDHTKAGKIYRTTAVDRILGLSRKVRARLSGRPTEPKRQSARVRDDG